MCTEIQRFATEVLQPAVSSLYTHAQNAITYVRDGVTWLDRKITDITRTILSGPAAVIASAVIKSIPFIAMRLFLPTPLLLTGIGLVVIYKLISSPKGEQISSPNLENGLAFGGILNGVGEMSPGFATSSLPTMIFGIVNIAASCLMLLRSGFISDLCGSPQPLPIPGIPI